ncbi:MAG: anti-sigma factor antagonist [Victivallaceae bacterium]|jgi:anti-anti-sigma factor
MEIEQLNIDDKLTCLALAGSLDMGSVMEVKAEFARLASSGKPVLLDMSDLTFIASCGMQMVLAALKRINPSGLKMAVLNPQPMVKTAWEIAGMAIIVPVFTNQAAAFEYLKIKPGGSDLAETAKPGKNISLKIGNDLNELAGLCHEVHGFLEDEKMSAASIYKIDLSLEEMLTNVIKYSYDDDDRHEISVSLQIDADRILLEMRDDGHEFNPLEAPLANLSDEITDRQVGGMGIHLTRTMVDAISYSREGSTNVVTVSVNIN